MFVTRRPGISKVDGDVDDQKQGSFHRGVEHGQIGVYYSRRIPCIRFRNIETWHPDNRRCISQFQQTVFTIYATEMLQEYANPNPNPLFDC